MSGISEFAHSPLLATVSLIIRPSISRVSEAFPRLEQAGEEDSRLRIVWLGSGQLSDLIICAFSDEMNRWIRPRSRLRFDVD